MHLILDLMVVLVATATSHWISKFNIFMIWQVKKVSAKTTCRAHTHIFKMESWNHLGRTANIFIQDIIHIFASISKNICIYLANGQAGKLNFFGTHPNWAFSYIAYTKFPLPRPVFHLPSQIFTRIGGRASTSFPAMGRHYRERWHVLQYAPVAYHDDWLYWYRYLNSTARPGINISHWLTAQNK